MLHFSNGLIKTSLVFGLVYSYRINYYKLKHNNLSK